MPLYAFRCDGPAHRAPHVFDAEFKMSEVPETAKCRCGEQAPRHYPGQAVAVDGRLTGSGRKCR